MASKPKPICLPYVETLTKQIVDNKWTRSNQIDEGLKWLDGKLKEHGSSYVIDLEEMDKATGVGVVVSQDEIDAAVDKIIADNLEKIKEKGHNYPFGALLKSVRDIGNMMWADGALILATMNKKKVELLGEPPVVEEGKRIKKGKMTTEEKKAAKQKQAPAEGEQAEAQFDIKQLIGRDVDAGNSAELLAKHRAVTGGNIVTRFPPEPNGYLHIGHAKAIRFNFTVAKEYGGYTFLRYDDTNPCKENNEFIKF